MKKILIIIGVSILSISIILFLFINISVNNNIKRNDKTIEKIENMFDYKLTNYKKNDFSTLEIDGIDYKGIIEIDSINAKLPVSSFCNYKIQSSCYYSNDILTVMVTNLNDSVKNYNDIEVGDDIIYYDMIGNMYKFNIKKVSKIKKLDDINNDYNMCLIVKNYFELSYTVYYSE